jgi:acetate kinase
VRHILALNAGSSSIKFALFENGAELVECVRGQVEGLGASPRLQAEKAGTKIANELLGVSRATDHTTALDVVLEFLGLAVGKVTIAAVGHRVVHGGPTFSESVIIDE